MKISKPVTIICTIGIMFLLAGAASAQYDETGELQKIGIGVQFSFPAWGASGMYNLNEQMSVQGIFGFIGDLKVYGGRFLYRFNRKENLNVYGYGMVGGFSYKGAKVNTSGSIYTWSVEETTETVMGFGAGAGVEYFMESLPEIGWNLEIGIGVVDFDDVDYTFSSFMFGVGAHYYF